MRIRGRVQGVGYRDACVEQARRLGVTGWVRNRHDGSVEVEMYGTVAQLNALARWLADGPPFAEVRNVALQPKPAEATACTSFERLPTS
ncbi:acylphosphatase [Aquincola tertiaricarbonis]|uniref:acylphosphatase n=1 Tax=Aquincola tertiaricarbonis TaxID=391953 RepID=UPI0035BEE7CE